MVFLLPGTIKRRPQDVRERVGLSETQIQDLHRAGFPTIGPVAPGTPRLKRPTLQERLEATERGLKERGLKGIEFILPGSKKSIELPSQLKPIISIGRLARTIQQEISRSGASLVLTYANVARFLTGQRTVDEIDISGRPLEACPSLPTFAGSVLSPGDGWRPC